MTWFRRPYRVYTYYGGYATDADFMKNQSRDGWYFVAFGIPFRVRNGRIYPWGKP